MAEQTGKGRASDRHGQAIGLHLKKTFLLPLSTPELDFQYRLNRHSKTRHEEHQSAHQHVRNMPVDKGLSSWFEKVQTSDEDRSNENTPQTGPNPTPQYLRNTFGILSRRSLRHLHLQLYT